MVSPEAIYVRTNVIFTASKIEIPAKTNGSAINQGKWYEKIKIGYPKPP
jgi:hypothetical protein